MFPHKTRRTKVFVFAFRCLSKKNSAQAGLKLVLHLSRASKGTFLREQQRVLGKGLGGPDPLYFAQKNKKKNRRRKGSRQGKPTPHSPLPFLRPLAQGLDPPLMRVHIPILSTLVRNARNAFLCSSVVNIQSKRRRCYCKLKQIRLLYTAHLSLLEI